MVLSDLKQITFMMLNSRTIDILLNGMPDTKLPKNEYRAHLISGISLVKDDSLPDGYMVVKDERDSYICNIPSGTLYKLSSLDDFEMLPFNYSQFIAHGKSKV